MIKSIMVAAAENNVIGKNGELPWHMPADLQYFKQVTSGHHVIMGRKTFESLGKPLPGRTNIVVTRQKDYAPEGAEIAHSLEEAFALADKNKEHEAMILGGGEIFRQALDTADKIYITRIYEKIEGDTFFPEINKHNWDEVKNDRHESDERNPYAYAFKVYIRK